MFYSRDPWTSTALRDRLSAVGDRLRQMMMTNEHPTLDGPPNKMSIPLDL